MENEARGEIKNSAKILSTLCDACYYCIMKQTLQMPLVVYNMSN